MLYKNLI